MSAGSSAGTTDGEVLAAWRHVRMARHPTAAGAHGFVVEEVDGVGNVVATTHYASQDFPFAADHYVGEIIRSLDAGTSKTATIFSRVALAFATSDVAVLEELLHEDYLHVDHRPLGQPNRDKSQMIADQLAHPGMGAVWLPSTVEAWNSAGGVGSGAWWTLEFDEWRAFEFGSHLIVIEDDQVRSVEIFSDDDREAAIDRFAELTDPAER